MPELDSQINLSDVQAWADRVWATPSPESMAILLDAMEATLRTLAARRGQIAGTQIWGPNREDPETLLANWDDRAQKLWFRLGAYRKRLNRVLAGKITGEFAGYVVQPILRGHGYASPDREAWSKVDFADVLTPFRLWNELGAYLRGTAAIEFFKREAQALVETFGEKVLAGAGRLGGVVGKHMAEEAQDFLDRAEEIADEKRQELSGTITAAIIGGGLLLGLGAFLVLRRSRRRAA